MTARNTTTRDKHRRTIARDKPDCGICGNPIDYTITNHLDPMAYTVDHIQPRKHGGPDTLENKQAAHRHCNRTKSDTLADGMTATAREYETTLTW